MPPIHALFFFVGIVALILSWLLLLIYSSREDFAWGLFTVLLPPLAYLYGLFHWDKAKEPLLLAVVGCVLIWIAVG